ncbi:MAG: hypothetical protein R3324_00220 [Halobacteriales archaeon]|nr:hypothetical protein [Halobacteriales archaeon]
MSGFDVYVFALDRRYVFRHFFDDADVFGALREHYVDGEYRFEVPVDEWADVADHLREHGYEPTVVEDPEPYCVVIGQYEPHADILRDSVVNWTRREHRFFLMRSPLAVEQAVQRGATPVAETEFEAGI